MLGTYIISVTVGTPFCVQAMMCATNGEDKQGVCNTIATKMHGTGLVKRTPGELRRKKRNLVLRSKEEGVPFFS